MDSESHTPAVIAFYNEDTHSDVSWAGGIPSRCSFSASVFFCDENIVGAVCSPSSCRRAPCPRSYRCWVTVASPLRYNVHEGPRVCAVVGSGLSGRRHLSTIFGVANLRINAIMKVIRNRSRSSILDLEKPRIHRLEFVEASWSMLLLYPQTSDVLSW